MERVLKLRELGPLAAAVDKQQMATDQSRELIRERIQKGRVELDLKVAECAFSDAGFGFTVQLFPGLVKVLL